MKKVLFLLLYKFSFTKFFVPQSILICSFIQFFCSSYSTKLVPLGIFVLYSITICSVIQKVLFLLFYNISSNNFNLFLVNNYLCSTYTRNFFQCR
jgi:hypothetical protein